MKSCIQSWCQKCGVSTSFSEWKKVVISAIDEKISYLSPKPSTEIHKNTLKLEDEIIHEELKMLSNKFVVDPVDKGSGNVAFVCQRHYA